MKPKKVFLRRFEDAEKGNFGDETDMTTGFFEIPGSKMIDEEFPPDVTCDEIMPLR
jgi:hypothetical protein